MKQLLLFILSLTLLLSCNKKDDIKKDTQSNGAALKIITNGDFKSKQSGNFSDTSTWAKWDGSAWNDAHEIPSALNNVFIDSGHTVTLTSNQVCKDLSINTNADVIRLNTGSFILDVWGELSLYEGPAPGNNVTTITSSGVINYISGNIRFNGDHDRIIIDQGKYNANNTNSGWKCIINFSPGKTAFINDRVRIENVEVVSGNLRFREELRIGTNYPGQGLDTTVNGVFKVRSGCGVIAGSKIIKSPFAKCDSVIFEPNTWMSLTRTASINSRVHIGPDTIYKNGYTITY